MSDEHQSTAPSGAIEPRHPTGILAWFVRNGVAANLLMILIIAGGLVTVPRIRTEVFPEVSSDLITVSVAYLGAGPEEVEEAVCARIEEQVQSLEVVKKVRSTAREGVGVVTLELLPDTDLRAALDDVKARVDAIDTFPEETEKPIVQEVTLRIQVLYVAVSGDADERTLKRLGEQVRDEIGALDGVTQVELVAARPYEVSIEVSEDALRRHGLTFDQVAAAVRRSSLDLPGGSVRTRGGEILLRTVGQADLGAEFAELVLTTRPDGTRLRIGDVARVVDGFAETDQASRFDGKPAVLVQIFRVGEQRVTDIASRVKDYVSTAQARMPTGIDLTVWQDDTVLLSSRLDTLYRNGRAGLFLVLLVLALFLRLRLAAWVSVGILVSFLGALWLMPALDLSINVISLFAFIVVLGIVVDDAIVVGENIYRHHEMGKDGRRAAIDGVREVAVPVVFSILTTIAAFAPLTIADGQIGKVVRVIALIVISTLVFSLIESTLVLPRHLSHLHHRGASNRSPGLWQRLQTRTSRGLLRFVERVYRPLLERALAWRYTTLALGFGLLLVTLGLVGGGHIKFTFFPAIEADKAIAALTLPQGTPAEETAQVVARIEQAGLDLRRELEQQGDTDVFRHLLTTVGEQPCGARQGERARFRESESGAHLAEVCLELSPAEVRSVSAGAITERWRDLVGAVPDAVSLTFDSSLFSTGKPIDIQLSGPDLEQLQAAGDALIEELRGYPGIFDLADSFRAGKQEVKVDVTSTGEALGLTLSDVARQVRQAFYGEEAQRIQRGRDDVRVMVRYPTEERRSLGDLEDMRVRTPRGDEVPFSVAADLELGRGFASIARTDRYRTVNVTADLDLDQGNANEILADVERNVMPKLLADHPGIGYALVGEQQEQRETLQSLGRNFLIALVLIYGLLAVPFRSYLQPLIVMIAIPFGFIGAIWGHVAMGVNLTALSGFGVVALTGVVVNDSLVLVDFINRRRRAGASVHQAISDAGVQRFRPIVLTSLTTFVGLLPLLLEKSLQAQFLIPMAISLAFGVLFATVIVLLLVPVIYAILEDVVRRALQRPEAQPSAEAEVQPAAEAGAMAS